MVLVVGVVVVIGFHLLITYCDQKHCEHYRYTLFYCAILDYANRWGNSGQWLILFFWAPKSLQMVIAAMKLIDAYSLEGKL